MAILSYFENGRNCKCRRFSQFSAKISYIECLDCLLGESFGLFHVRRLYFFDPRVQKAIARHP